MQDSVSFPVLIAANEVRIEQNVKMTSLSLPMLATANNINIIGNLRLATASLCQLHSIVGSMTFTGNDMLKRIDLPNLEISKGVVAVEDQGALELLDLFSLTEAVKGEGEGKERNTLYIYLYLSISLSLYL